MQGIDWDVEFSLGALSRRMRLLLAYFGGITGMAFFQMVARWIYAITVVAKKRWTYDGQLVQRRTLLWALPIVLLLDSGPGAIALTLFGVTRLFGDHPAELDWFFAGFGIAVLLFVYLTVTAGLRIRQRRLLNATPKPSNS